MGKYGLTTGIIVISEMARLGLTGNKRWEIRLAVRVLVTNGRFSLSRAGLRNLE